MDNQLIAINKIIDALKGMNSKSRKAALIYAGARYGVELEEPKTFPLYALQPGETSSGGGKVDSETYLTVKE